MNGAIGASHPAGSFENRMPNETLAPDRRFSAGPHINSM
jgi:hypothetical protein